MTISILELQSRGLTLDPVVKCVLVGYWSLVKGRRIDIKERRSNCFVCNGRKELYKALIAHFACPGQTVICLRDCKETGESCMGHEIVDHACCVIYEPDREHLTSLITCMGLISAARNF